MNGILILDKPQGFTSFDAVAKLRGITRERKIGHGGTLDPMATGVLPVFLGSATKAIALDPDDRKEYVAEIRTGAETDTGDITGKTVRVCEPLKDTALFERAAAGFIGRTMQTPPMDSAVRVDGKHLYDIAREGRVINRPAREITVDAIEVEAFTEGTVRVRIRCRKGTYIRTLAEDIMKAAGSLGTLSSLRRTRSGGYTEDRCVTLSELETTGTGIEELLLPVESVFQSYPEAILNEENARRFRNGVPVKYLRNMPEGRIRIKSGGIFLGIGEMREGVLFKLRQFI